MTSLITGISNSKFSFLTKQYIIIPMRRVRYNIDGHGRFLTFSCFHNKPFLSSKRACNWFLESLLSTKEKHGFLLWGYVIMPNHVHLLIKPNQGSDVSKILADCKRAVTSNAISWIKQNNPESLDKLIDHQPNGKQAYRFWQRGGGYDRNVYTAEEIHKKLKYIHSNPVQKGLAERLEDWEWSSYNAWQSHIDEPIPIDRDEFPMLAS